MADGYFSDEDFVRESNRIEGIHRDPTAAEMEEFKRFIALPSVAIKDIEQFVAIYQPRFPKGELRDRADIPGVRVGNHIAPPSGPDIRARLEHLVRCANARSMSAYEVHIAYETLHPFTDGNGRSGRMFWRWQMGKAPIGFLHQFYYQTLAASQPKRVDPMLEAIFAIEAEQRAPRKRRASKSPE